MYVARPEDIMEAVIYLVNRAGIPVPDFKPETGLRSRGNETIQDNLCASVPFIVRV